MIIGALLQATAYSRAQMIVARVVSGCGMGAINSTVPVFQSEFSPKATRGLCKYSLSLINNSLLHDFHVVQSIEGPHLLGNRPMMPLFNLTRFWSC